MKPFLAIDLTFDKKNEQYNGDEFLVSTPSQALIDSLNNASEQVLEAFEKSKLPLPLRIAEWVCGIVGFVILGATIKALAKEDSLTIEQAYQNAPWFFWICGICLVVWAVLMFFSYKKQKSVLGSDESANTFQSHNDICNAIFAELKVPEDAKEVDILSFSYKIKNDKIKISEKDAAPFCNFVFRVFADCDNFYLANTDGKYAFPLSSIKSIKTEKKLVVADSWNKEEDCNKGIYKQYKISEDKNGNIMFRKYHIIEIDCFGEVWGVYIPCYELPIFEELTNLKAE